MRKEAKAVSWSPVAQRLVCGSDNGGERLFALSSARLY